MKSTKQTCRPEPPVPREVYTHVRRALDERNATIQQLWRRVEELENDLIHARDQIEAMEATHSAIG
jgi:hypothetical protein